MIIATGLTSYSWREEHVAHQMETLVAMLEQRYKSMTRKELMIKKMMTNHVISADDMEEAHAEIHNVDVEATKTLLRDT